MQKEAACVALAGLVVRADDTVVRIVQAAAIAAHKWLIMQRVQDVDTDAIAADELWSFVQKNFITA